MPRNSSGVYTLPAGNPVVAFTTITTAWANPTMADVGNELTNSLDRQGRGGMLAPFRIFDGNISQPGLGFLNEVGLGLWRASAGLMHIVNSGVNVISIYNDRIVFPVTSQIFDDTQYRQIGSKNWQIINDGGLLAISPSTAIDGEVWDGSKATIWDPNTGVPSFPVVPGSGYVRITGDTMTGALTLVANTTTIVEHLSLSNTGNSADNGNKISFFNAGVATPAGYIIGKRIGASVNFGLEFGTSPDLTTAVTRMSIDGSGNVGIGGVPTQKLEVFGQGKFSGTVTTGGSLIATGSVQGSNSSFTGAVLAGDGTVGAPGFGFSSIGNADYGMFLSGTTLGWSLNGTQALWLNSTGLGIGRAPVDKLTVGSNTDAFNVRITGAVTQAIFGGTTAGLTGAAWAFDRAGGNVSLRTGVWETLANTAITVASSTGNVGIGAVPTLGKLHVAADADPQIAIEDLGNWNTQLQVLGSVGAFVIKNGGTESLRIDAAGNVGIGTVPGYKLHVVGGATNAIYASSNGNQLLISPGDNNKIFNIDYGAQDVRMGVDYGYGIANIIIRNNNADRVWFAPTGNVGIGVAPTSKLHVLLPDTTATSAVRAASSGTVSPLFSSFFTGIADWAFGQQAGTGNFLFAVNPADYTAAALATAAKMTITGAGNVGIGGTPINTLTVYGDGALRLVGSGSSNGTQMRDLAGASVLNVVDNRGLDLMTANAVRMSITNVGYVGIGVTPMATNPAQLYVAGPLRIANAAEASGGDLRWRGDATGWGLTFRSQNATTGALNPVVMTVFDGGRIETPLIHNNSFGAAGTVPMLASGNGNTAVASAFSNITAVTPLTQCFMRVGNVVTVSGYLEVSATTAGAGASFHLSIPILDMAEGGGTFCVNEGAAFTSGLVAPAGSGGVILSYVPTSTVAARAMRYHYTYRVV